MRRLLVVSSWAPPTIGGTPTLLRALFRALDGAGQVEIEVIRRRVVPEVAESPSHWRSVTLRGPRRLERVRGAHYALAPLAFFHVLARIVRGRTIAVMAVLPEESFAVAAAGACALARRPFGLYIVNSYAEQAIHPLDKLLARFADRWLIQRATPLIVLSEALGDLYERKYGVRSIVIPHIVDTSEYTAVQSGTLPTGLVPYTYALFTGDVYEINLESLLRIQHVIRTRFRGRLRFVISGLKTSRELRDLGLEPDLVLTGIDRERLIALQKNAAVLLAPLAFESLYPVEVRTAMPTKVIEYLAAGQPILVHAPAESFLTGRAREEGWAEIADEPSEEALASALDRLLHDRSLRRRGSASAARAVQEHSPERLAERFLRACDLAVRGYDTG